MIAKVEPLTTARALRGPFDYRLPDDMEAVGVGSVLRIPFGRRRMLGVVVELAERSELPDERLAEPLEALEAGVPAELVRLGLWVAREYCSTPSRGLQLVLPPGTGASGESVRTRRVLRASLTEAGSSAIAGGQRLGSRQRRALEALASRGPALVAELAQRCGADHATLRRLESRGLVSIEDAAVRRDVPAVAVGARGAVGSLTADQRRAVESVVAALDGDAERDVLLHGVTGSGKTEVYLEALEATLARGQGAIVLVPEIGLTPQTVSRVRARFGDTVAVLHSRLPAGARYDEWMRLRSGRARICVGPRSAVFAPVAALGLIVIDEEHDPSYKQEGDPRYDARAVARRRAIESGAVIVSGTATPRPEAWLALPRLALPGRVDGRTLPPVEVLDMRGLPGGVGPLHPRTLEGLDEVRRAGAKAIVMLNRRGWSAFLACRTCGRTWGCPSCDVSLVLHRASGRVWCHHCGHAEAVPEACPDCGSASVARHGAGTERIEAMLARALDPMPVIRLDADAAAGPGAHGAILRRFEEADSALLVGTQMVAKGHDFPDVVLAAILDADATLRFPDFRSEERTFSLITQLAGRSGRGPGGGRVLVQTLAPDAPSVRFAARHDAAGFLEGELARRGELRYPPYSHLAAVHCAAPDAEAADRAAAGLARLLGETLPSGTDLLGPAPLFRVQGRERRRIVLKASDRAATVAGVRAAVEGLAATGELAAVAVSVDVDPQ